MAFSDVGHVIKLMLQLCHALLLFTPTVPHIPPIVKRACMYSIEERGGYGIHQRMLFMCIMLKKDSRVPPIAIIGDDTTMIWLTVGIILLKLVSPNVLIRESIDL